VRTSEKCESAKVRKCESAKVRRPGGRIASGHPSGAGKPAAGTAASPVSRRGAARTGLQRRFGAPGRPVTGQSAKADFANFQRRIHSLGRRIASFRRIGHPLGRGSRSAADPIASTWAALPPSRNRRSDPWMRIHRSTEPHPPIRSLVAHPPHPPIGSFDAPPPNPPIRSLDAHPPHPPNRSLIRRSLIRVRDSRREDAGSGGHPQPRRIHPPATRIQSNDWRHAWYGERTRWPFTSAPPHSRTHALSLLSRAERGSAIMYAHPASSGGPFMSRNAAHV
jgi:hypothetical protein